MFIVSPQISIFPLPSMGSCLNELTPTFRSSEPLFMTTLAMDYRGIGAKYFLKKSSISSFNCPVSPDLSENLL
jgi:hypothetical protein